MDFGPEFLEISTYFDFNTFIFNKLNISFQKTKFDAFQRIDFNVFLLISTHFFNVIQRIFGLKYVEICKNILTLF
jgi:hypothetical protein